MKRLATILLMLTACGDPLVGSSYIGGSIYELSGTIDTAGGVPLDIDPEALRIGLFFVGFDGRGHVNDFVEHTAEVDAAFTQFSMRVFDAPDDVALTFSDLADEPEARIGISLIVVYADQDGDGVLDAGGPFGMGEDRVVGASRRHLVVYSSAPLDDSGPAGELLGPLEPGYHLFENSEDGTCPFLNAFNCEGAGEMRPTPDATPVVSIFDNRTGVLVPAPVIVPNGTLRDSIWSMGR